MFDFQKLNVYKKIRLINKKVFLFIRDHPRVPLKLKDQLFRATLSIALNTAEGAGRLTQADKKHYYVQARSTLFETVACLEVCFDIGEIDGLELSEFENRYEEISKMLFSMSL